MGLVWILEILSAVFGLILFRYEVVKLRCKNFVPSIFLLLYVPLFCITPILYHFIIGGALTIDHKNEGIIFKDAELYYVYHLYNLSMLFCFFIFSFYFNKIKEPERIASQVFTSQQNFLFFFALFAGVYLYVYSTGLSPFELLVADRFVWFENTNYSSFYSVIASYLISLSPLLIYIYVKDKKYLFLLITILLLIVYGILSKDRKWIIYMLSGFIGAKFYLNGNKIIFKTKIIIGSVIFGLILMFWQIFRDVLFTELVTGRGDFFSHALEMAEQLALKGDFPYYYFSSMTAIKMNIVDGFSIPFGIIRRQLFFMIPVDYSFGLKIKDISAIFSDALDAGDQIRGGNMPPGLIGLFVLSFNWWFGILFYILIPFFLYYINVLARKYNLNLQTIIYSNCFSFMILILRGDDSSAIYFLIFNLIIYILIKNILLKKELVFIRKSKLII